MVLVLRDASGRSLLSMRSIFFCSDLILRKPRPIQPLGAVSKDVQPAGIQPLHLAVGELSVGVLLRADADDLVGLHLALLHPPADADVLHRELVTASCRKRARQ